MRPSQDPTCVGMRVRSTRDANVIFHAVALSILPMVVRRLDAADRAALRPGCVYVWEERAPSSDATGVGSNDKSKSIAIMWVRHLARRCLGYKRGQHRSLGPSVVRYPQLILSHSSSPVKTLYFRHFNRISNSS